MRQQLATQESWTEVETIHRGGQDGSFAASGRQHSANLLERRRLLTQAVEQRVIPQLLMQRRGTPFSRSLTSSDQAPVRLPRPATESDVLELAGLALVPDQDLATTFISGLRDQGMPTDALYLDVLAPAARHLGALWEDDVLHFTEVTLGLVRLQHVMHQFSHALPDVAPPDRERPQALLVPVPGAQHSFGLAMVVEFFRNAGWGVWSGHLPAIPDLSRMVSDQWFGVVGLSASRGDDLEPIVKSIRSIRRSSRNRDVAVLVGGPIFMENSDLATQVGADGTALDGRQAVLEAEKLLTVRIGRR